MQQTHKVQKAREVYFLYRIQIILETSSTRWFKYDQDYLCVNKSQFVPVIFEPPCTLNGSRNDSSLTVLKQSTSLNETNTEYDDSC
jgi:hypothetical protein